MPVNKLKVRRANKAKKVDLEKKTGKLSFLQTIFCMINVIFYFFNFKSCELKFNYILTNRYERFSLLFFFCLEKAENLRDSLCGMSLRPSIKTKLKIKFTGINKFYILF